MKKEIDLVMWDLDGTLLDTKKGIINAIKETIKVNHLKNLTDDELQTFIGPPFKHIFPKYFGGTEEEITYFVSSFRKIYEKKELFNASLFDGVVNVMKKLKQMGKYQTLTTYKTESFAKKLVTYFNVDMYLDMILGSSDEDNIPKYEMLNTCIKKFNINDKSRAVLLGDTQYDYEATILCGCCFIACDYGYGNKEFKELDDLKQTTIGHINNPYELFDYIV